MSLDRKLSSLRNNRHGLMENYGTGMVSLFVKTWLFNHNHQKSEKQIRIKTGVPDPTVLLDATWHE